MATAFLISLHFILLYALFAIYVERKTAAFIQNRLGPYEVGPFGLLQPLADILKLLQKQEPIPRTAYRAYFQWAPCVSFLALLTAFSCLPLFPEVVFLRAPVGVLMVVAIVSLDVWAILIAGWASGSKFSTYGAFRAVGQMIAYEVPMGCALVSVVIVTGSLDFIAIAEAQHPEMTNHLWVLSLLPSHLTQAGGFLSWHLFSAPVLIPVALMFFISAVAHTHRMPFDLPEAESELVAGYHTEYSGFRWSLFMLTEYGLLFLMSFLMVWLFLGAGYSPLPNIYALECSVWTNDPQGIRGGWFLFWTLSKTLTLVWIQMWIRWSIPRLRMDQLIHFCWLYLTPLSIIWVYLSALWTFL